MPKFIYKAKQGPGQLVDGVIEAENLDSAVRKITQLGYYPMNVLAQGEVSAPTKKNAKSSAAILPISRRISVAHVAIFTRQIYVLIDSGVPLLKTLRTVLNQTHNPQVKSVVADMHDFIEDGGTFSDALARHRGVFSRLYVNMVKT